MTRIHSKKLTIFFLAFTTLFTCILHVCFYQENTQKTWQANHLRDLLENSFGIHSDFSSDLSSALSSKLLRFRVLANSDSEEDQNRKNDLCKEVIALLSPALSNVQTKEEAITLVRESLPFLTAYCNDVLSNAENTESCSGTLLNDASSGDAFSNTMPASANTSVTCTIGPHLFPYKTYDDCQFPTGIYDTLLVTIGEGRGSNWWCLAFPPLCFADEAFLDVPDSSKQTLLRILGADLFDEICVTEDEADANADALSENTNTTDSETTDEINGKRDDKRGDKKEQPKLTLGLFF